MDEITGEPFNIYQIIYFYRPSYTIQFYTILIIKFYYIKSTTGDGIIIFTILFSIQSAFRHSTLI